NIGDEGRPSDRADQSLDVRVLPRRSGSSRLVPNAHGTQPLPEDHAIRSVSVPNKIAKCTVPGKRLNDLTRNPLRGRICLHPERYPQPACVTQNHKAIEQPERYRRQHEEVDCRDTIDMVGQKGPPALRWRPTPVQGHRVSASRLAESNFWYTQLKSRSAAVSWRTAV